MYLLVGSCCFAKWISEDPKLRLELLAALPAAAFKFVVAREIESNYVPNPVRFDQRRWINAGEDDGELRMRFCMVASLTESHKLVGMSEEQITHLLGKPIRSSEVGRGRKYLVYEMGRFHGYEHSLSISLLDNLVDRFEVNKVAAEVD